ncbi:hypothetical protein [Rugosimonospora acidiphila]|uniref:hypothetical protein n=1 Tax=Rugosimonospora acidiphila TaxID=556531 RepID=UPI0031E7BF24
MVITAALASGDAVAGSTPGGHPPAAADATIGCPDTDPQTTPNEPNQDLTTLVPGQPAGAIVCRYHGQDDAPSLPRSLANSATIDADRAAALAAAFNSGQPGPSDLINCPRDDDSTIRVYYSYQDGRTVVLTGRRTGCQLISNGTTGRFESTAAQQQLANLVG